jgi:hypothetical protein
VHPPVRPPVAELPTAKATLELLGGIGRGAEGSASVTTNSAPRAIVITAVPTTPANSPQAMSWNPDERCAGLASDGASEGSTAAAPQSRSIGRPDGWRGPRACRR